MLWRPDCAYVATSLGIAGLYVDVYGIVGIHCDAEAVGDYVVPDGEGDFAPVFLFSGDDGRVCTLCLEIESVIAERGHVYLAYVWKVYVCCITVYCQIEFGKPGLGGIGLWADGVYVRTESEFVLCVCRDGEEDCEDEGQQDVACIETIHDDMVRY